jgi:hypothetical protein
VWQQHSNFIRPSFVASLTRVAFPLSNFPCLHILTNVLYLLSGCILTNLRFKSQHIISVIVLKLLLSCYFTDYSSCWVSPNTAPRQLCMFSLPLLRMERGSHSIGPVTKSWPISLHTSQWVRNYQPLFLMMATEPSSGMLRKRPLKWWAMSKI